MRGECAEEACQVGRELSYRYVQPAELPLAHLDAICTIVEMGGAVDTGWVRHNLERAYLIGYATNRGTVVGCSSLKHPRPEYVARLREKCGLEVQGFLERGYMAVRPEWRGRGIGTRLLQGLTARAQGRPIYSIIREDDLATQRIALRSGTEKVASFYSEKAGKAVGLWMPVGTRERTPRIREPLKATELAPGPGLPGVDR